MRRWVFRGLALVLVPCLMLAGAEAILRLAGYGYSTAFFRPFRIGNQDFLVENDAFGYRFFRPEVARLPTAVRMAARKPAGTYRIFLFGESAAMGDPEPAFGAGRYLQALLRDRYPGAQFELVNVAMTAINSHAVLPIARECAGQSGDLWIIYLGNNEMVGPFGAATVFGAQAPPLPVIRLSLALQRLRLGQLLVAWGRGIKGRSAASSAWRGMQMFSENRVAPDDPKKRVVYANFKKNLEAILQAGRRSGAKVVLSTVAVNLRDCPPFASATPAGGAGAEGQRWERLTAQVATLAGQGNWLEASNLCDQANQLFPRSAALHFQWAEILRRLSNAIAAREHYQMACDLDALPFRADSRINQLIAEASQKWGGPDLILCDAPHDVAARSEDGIPGQAVFHEHVHFNFDGNYLLARAWADQVERLLPAGITRQGGDGLGCPGCLRTAAGTDRLESRQRSRGDDAPASATSAQFTGE